MNNNTIRTTDKSLKKACKISKIRQYKINIVIAMNMTNVPLVARTAQASWPFSRNQNFKEGKWLLYKLFAITVSWRQ